MKIGEVHPDPRGKILQGGQREHIFTVRAGDFVRVMRFPSPEAAEAARLELLERQP